MFLFVHSNPHPGGVKSAAMPTRLFIQCPRCKVRYSLRQTPARYSNGTSIENVAGAPEWRRLICHCSPDEPYKFHLGEKTRVQLLSEEDAERTHFPWNKKS